MNCYICGGECVKDVIHGSYIYWKCRDCFTSQVLPQPSEQELYEFYNRYHLCTESGGVYDEVEDRMKADFPFKANLLRRHMKKFVPRLLDVGCGKGYFVHTALKNGFDAEGIDISQSAVDYAVNSLGVKARAGKIDECLTEWHETFDAITFWATIEHIAKPMEALHAIYNCLKP